MFKFKNEKLSMAKEEKAKKTLARLEKINAKLEKFQKGIGYGIVGLGIGGGTLAGGLTGAAGVLMGKGWLVDIIGFAGLGAFAAGTLSVPVATALIAVPTVIKDVINVRIKALQKRLNISKNLRPTEEIIQEQEEEVNRVTKVYEDRKDVGTKIDIKAAKKDMDKEKHIQEVFQKATELAKEDKKEETVKRLMNIATRHESKTGKYAIYTGIQAMSGLTAKFVVDYTTITPKATPYFKAAAGVCFVAAAYEAVKTAISIAPAIKERRDAKRAFRILEGYTRYR